MLVLYDQIKGFFINVCCAPNSSYVAYLLLRCICSSGNFPGRCARPCSQNSPKQSAPGRIVVSYLLPRSTALSPDRIDPETPVLGWSVVDPQTPFSWSPTRGGSPCSCCWRLSQRLLLRQLPPSRGAAPITRYQVILEASSCTVSFFLLGSYMGLALRGGRYNRLLVVVVWPFFDLKFVVDDVHVDGSSSQPPQLSLTPALRFHSQLKTLTLSFVNMHGKRRYLLPEENQFLFS